jgi:phospholipase/lecithinase/hemolysin
MFFDTFAYQVESAFQLHFPLITNIFLLLKKDIGLEMESYLTKWCVVLVLLCFGFSVVKAQAQAQVPCFFVFGDSLVDNGNNNGLISIARSNYFPYGIDFGGPTGRFSNGKTTVDVIAELLGFNGYIPAYNTVSGRQILSGVNYASAAAGIREETGRQLGQRISFSGQVRNYQTTVSQVVQLLGDETRAADYLKRCIYSVGLGSNDYLNNYFMPTFYSSSRQFTPEQYANDLISRYSTQLNALYNYGARKFALSGIGAVGCSPNALAGSPDGRTCVDRINSANQIFNNKLRSLVDQLNNNHPDAKFIYINAYGIFQDMITNPARFGFRVTNAGCCGIGRNAGQITCLPGQRPCRDRNAYVFWDAFHPTEAANVIIARRSYNAQSASDAYPMDISRLAQL